jgi:signal transduction histidine kinase
MQREMDKRMQPQEQMILLVSDDAMLCAAARLELETRQRGLRVAAVSTIEAARRIVEDSHPAVILLEEASVGVEPDGPRGKAPLLDAAVSSLAVYAPVVVLGAAGHEREVSEVLAGGAADYVARTEGYLPVTLALLERRLRQSQGNAGGITERKAGGSAASPEFVSEDFGEVLRHELNNPLTGILGNAELLLAEVRRESNGKLPQGGQQRIETIAALAVRLRETVRRLSLEWEARQSEPHTP